MSDHVAVMSESFTTMVTLERLVPCVGPHVLLQGPGCAELLSAQLALDSTVVLGDHVLAGVGGELGAMCETLVTLVTPQVFVRTVRRHVGDHLTARGEDLITLVALECLVWICARR